MRHFRETDDRWFAVLKSRSSQPLDELTSRFESTSVGGALQGAATSVTERLEDVSGWRRGGDERS